MPKPSLYRGFVAINRQGHFLWATICRTEEAAQERHDQLNPDPTGEGMGEKIVPVEIRLDKNSTPPKSSTQEPIKSNHHGRETP